MYIAKLHKVTRVIAILYGVEYPHAVNPARSSAAIDELFEVSSPHPNKEWKYYEVPIPSPLTQH